MASQMRLDQIRDLVNQWEQLVGFAVTVADWMINEMADSMNYAGQEHAITSLYDVGRYMSFHIGDPARGDTLWDPVNAVAMPWAAWGMSAIEYNSKLGAWDNAFRVLTGQSVSREWLDQALTQHQGTMTGQQFETWLLAQDAIKNQYGWLKYGLDFQQFQTQKLQMRTGFGRELTDEEAVAQLRYHHAAQGPTVGVTAQAQQTQQQRREAQVGVSGSVVR